MFYLRSTLHEKHLSRTNGFLVHSHSLNAAWRESRKRGVVCAYEAENKIAAKTDIITDCFLSLPNHPFVDPFQGFLLEILRVSFVLVTQSLVLGDPCMMMREKERATNPSSIHRSLDFWGNLNE